MSSAGDEDVTQSDYERLFHQCQGAMNELETLRCRNAETSSRHEKAVEEAHYYRSQHQRSISKMEEMALKQKSLLAKCEQWEEKYEEIVLLREQEKMETIKSRQQPPMVDSNDDMMVASISGGTKSCQSITELRQQHDDLQFSMDDLQASYDILKNTLQQVQDENIHLKKRNNDITVELDTIIDERNALKTHMAKTIRDYTKAVHDREEEIADAKLLKQQHVKQQREQEQQQKLLLQMRSDLMKAREERNCAMKEYKLVMSERDTVHQEIEKLQDGLCKTRDGAKKMAEEKEKALHEKEGLRLEIIAVLADRDTALKEVNDLRSRLQIALKDKQTSAKQLEEQRQDFEMLKQERNAAKKERGEAIVHRDKILKECFEVKGLFADMEAGETGDITDGLKKKFDKLSHELTEAWSIAEVAITRRDWSFSERDKVIRELESMKERYVALVKEKLALEERVKLLSSTHGDLQDNYNNLLPTSVVSNKIDLLSSQDSAIDQDTPAYHIENVILERTSAEEDYGFQIGGGAGSPIGKSNDTSIYVTDVVFPNSIAANKLQINDCIICVNNVDMTNIESRLAAEKIFCPNRLDITILRSNKVETGKLGFRTPLHRVAIRSTEDKSLGLSIDSGLHVKRIDAGSAAAEEETLSIGDKILSVNGHVTDNMTYKECKLLLKGSMLSLTVLKPSLSSTYSHPSLPQHIDDDKIGDVVIMDASAKKFNVSEKLFSPVADDQLIPPPEAHHARNSSAPVCKMMPTHDLAIHNRSISGIGQMSDKELEKISADLFAEVQRRKEDDTMAKPSTLAGEDQPPIQRNSSYISAVKTNSVTKLPSQTSYPIETCHSLCRPTSAHSSKQSVSSGSTGQFSHDVSRYSPSSPNTFDHSDPLRLDLKALPGQGSGSTTPINCHTSQAKHHKAFTIPQSLVHNRQPVAIPELVQHRWSSHLYNSSASSTERITAQRRSLKEHMQGVGTTPVGTFATRHYGTFPGKPCRTNSDIASQSHSSTNTSKPGSSRSFGSRGSFNSSEFSDKGTSILGNIGPLNEETLDNLLEFTPATCANISARSSARSARSMGPISGGRSCRQRSSTSPSFLRSHKSQKIERNVSPETVCEEENPRKTVIDKGPYPLGITIGQGISNGVFVTGVNEDSIARKVGLKYGDQLLEYNGINLRTASYEQAAHIMKQSALENTVTVLVQYNPHKMYSNISNSPIPEADDHAEELRYIRIERESPSTPLGISLCGGNAIGVFVSDIQKNSLVELQGGLRCGDQILQYNAKDFRACTLEDATLELNKPTEVADFRVQYNPTAYKKAQSELGDSFFVRAMFDRTHPPKGELSFHKGDILHVTETMYNRSLLGVWRASIVTDNPENDEYKKTRGKIPNKMKAEQEMLLRRPVIHSDEKLKNRKSLFRRSKKGSSHHGINHSRESSDSKTSKDLEVASTISSGTSFALTQVMDDNIAYQRVKQLNSKFPRPVAIIGAMAEPICDKLVVEHGLHFARCLPDINESTKDIINDKINDGTYIDYKLTPKGDRYQCITPKSIKDVIIGKSKHCLLDVNPEAVGKLSPLKLFPIIIFIKYKTAKQIRDVRDGKYIREKMSSKDAKEKFDLFCKIEKEFKQQFTVTLTCSNGLANIVAEIVECVKQQQCKTLWVADG